MHEMPQLEGVCAGVLVSLFGLRGLSGRYPEHLELGYAIVEAESE